MSVKVRRVDFYPDDWIAGTVGLDALERGIYITACAMIYSHGGPIRKDELKRCSGCHGNAYRRALARLVDLGKIIENEADFDVKRCGIELEKARIRVGNAQENGVKGGRPPKETKDLENPEVLDAGKLTRASSFLLQPTKKEEATPLSSGKAQTPSRDVPGEMTKIWNEECGSIVGARAPGQNRKRSCIARWRDEFGSDPEQWRAYCKRIAGSAFLRGESDRGWRADLDWVLEPRHLSRIMEGRYDNRLANGRAEEDGGRGPSGPPPKFEDLWDDDGNRKTSLPH